MVNEENDREDLETTDITTITDPAERLYRTVDIYKAVDMELHDDKIPLGL